jgi:PIN domain nuclease of toxin-antitoxin system
MILEEPGGERINQMLDDLDRGKELEILISSVNWCEVLSRMERAQLAITGEELEAAMAGVQIVPFGKSEAEFAAKFTTISRALSLGDRACVALAASRNCAAWTADRVWAQMKLGVKLELLR